LKPYHTLLDITKGVAQLEFSPGRFERTAVPLPPLAEQEQIVAEEERRLSVVAEMEA
jgi:restriction endonuclease S subunit